MRCQILLVASRTTWQIYLVSNLYCLAASAYLKRDLFSEQRLDRSQIETGQLIDDGLGASVDIRRARVLAVHTIHNAIVVPSVFRHLTFG